MQRQNVLNTYNNVFNIQTTQKAIIMIKTLSTNEVIEELMSDTNANWTSEEARALTAYYEELEDSLGKPIVLDVVAIRCDWVCDTLVGVVNDYDIHEEGSIETREEQLDWLRKQTQVIELSKECVLYVQF